MKHALIAVLLAALAVTSTGAGTEAPTVQLTDKSTVSFASVEEARRALSRSDDFVKRLSPFDRAARMKTDRKVPEKEFLEFAAGSALAWAGGELENVGNAIDSLRLKLAGLKWDFPKRILFIKTSGREEGNAAYTRGNAVILPATGLRRPRFGYEHWLAHELFHVLTRHNPKLRESLYPIVGFRPCGEIEFPKELAGRKLTNPDAPMNDYYITVSYEGKPLPVVPILYSTVEKYDPEKGGEFFRHLTMKLLAIEERKGRWAPQYRDGKPFCLDVSEVSGFHEQVGKNTGYIIHPEEILADNFAHLITGRENLPSPEIPRKMRGVLFAEKDKD